jgi:hypothetical protein
MSQKYIVTVKESRSENNTFLERGEKVEATRKYVLTTCVIAGALATFLIPVREGLPPREWAFTIISLSVVSYLCAIGLGVLHIMLLFHKELYSKENIAGETWNWAFKLAMFALIVENVRNVPQPLVEQRKG